MANKKEQKDKQRSTKHAHKTRSSNKNPTKNGGWTQVLQESKQFLLH
jgi:hypothetical protein